MRPRKKVLLLDNDDDRRGVTRFVLETHLFRVIEHGEADAVLIYDERGCTIRGGEVACFREHHYTTMERTIDLLKHACAKRRGPKRAAVQEVAA